LDHLSLPPRLFLEARAIRVVQTAQYPDIGAAFPDSENFVPN
jgi:hypothetical protein